MAFRDAYQTVTDQIIANLEAGTVPWVKDWSRVEFGLPCNAVTNKPYRGINVFLYFTSMAYYSSPRFLTYKQAKDAGGHVRKGEKGHVLYFFKPMVKNEGAADEQRYAILREYTVFNVDQCENLSDTIRYGRTGKPGEVRWLNQDQRNELADAFIKSTGASFKEGKGQPMYIPSLDQIKMPKWEEFHHETGFYHTAFHELTHWTGAKSRLDRDLKPRFDREAYAMEELVAELGAAFMSAEFGYKVVDNSAAYIGGWLIALKNDKRAIFMAAAAAQKAVDFLRGKALEDTTTEEIAA